VEEYSKEVITSFEGIKKKPIKVKSLNVNFVQNSRLRRGIK